MLGSIVTAQDFTQKSAQNCDHSEPQHDQALHQAQLRGSLTAERIWWDLLHYELAVDVDMNNRKISGTNTIRYKVLDNAKQLQIELQQPMVLVSAMQNNQLLAIRQDGYSYFIQTQMPQELGETYTLTLAFEGTPPVAKNAPWDGGFSWAEDGSGMPFIATSNQGEGASLWWPNKDHGYDEPDEGALIHVTVAQPFVAVANGRLIDALDIDEGTGTQFTWQVVNPINNYGININIGDYVNFSEKYQGEAGELDMEYYVLRENEEQARAHFKEAKRTLEAFEHWFGPYPFYQDSYKLVEVPYLGMEHQSSVTYGNGYQNGYKGRDLSNTGWGLLWDFIIVHESGHEWFANSITAKDVADLWIHEGFTSYSESLFIEYFYGKAAGAEYVRGVRKVIKNERPIIGQYILNQVGSGDMYPKGANMLHTIRQLVADDEAWRQLLRKLNQTFFHQVVTTEQIEAFISEQTKLDLGSVFDQYLRDVRVPIFEYMVVGHELSYRWSNVVSDFAMPLGVSINGNKQRLAPTTDWQTLENAEAIIGVNIDENYYVAAMAIALVEHNDPKRKGAN